MMNGSSRRALMDAHMISHELIKLVVTIEEYWCWKLNETYGYYL